MRPFAWMIVAVVAMVTAVALILWWRRQHRRALPMTAAEHLAAARQAARAIRRDSTKGKPTDSQHAPLHISDGAATSAGDTS